MQLATLLSGLPSQIALSGNPDIEIAAITSDSRRVTPGALFVAYQGVGVDGHEYVTDAVTRGATAVVCEKPFAGLAVPFVQVPDGREALAWLSATWHGNPSKAMRVVGITGTDGKTTTANLLFSILRSAGRRAGLISTVNAVIGESVYETGLHTTTPDAFEFQHYLALMRDAGTEDAVLEVTSHGLAQHRVTGCEFDVAVITNITHEHIDFHGSFEAYREAKAMLFRSLMRTPRKAGVVKCSVLNRDDTSFETLSAIPVERTVTYGIANCPSSGKGRRRAGAESQALDRWPQTDLTASNIRHTASGTELEVESREQPGGAVSVWHVATPLVGLFNVHNILAAIGAALALGVDVPAIQAGVGALTGVAGRMERVDRGQPFIALVDFAHTPHALELALEAARDLTASGGRVIVTFGCAGLRDREKRRLMGEAAARLADVTIITAEDPRTENLSAIMEPTAAALLEAGRIEGSGFLRVPDRLHAIQTAVRLARPGDVVILCGKGHEQSMCFGSTEYPWRDQEALAWALDCRQGRDTPPPYNLPTGDGTEGVIPCGSKT